MFAPGVGVRWPVWIRAQDSVVARVVISPGGLVYTGRKRARPADKPSTPQISQANNTAAMLVMFAHVLVPEADANEPADPFG